MSQNRKYTVFISSTYEDLKHERQEVVKACLEMGHIPIGMEMFSAANESQWEVIQRTIASCDYYVVILAARYGSTIASEGGISYTEKEYDYAALREVPILGFVLDGSAAWPENKRDADPAQQARLKNFKEKVRSKMASHWINDADLRGKFAIALSKAFEQYPRAGWVPSTQAASPEVTNQIARLIAENEQLRQQLNSMSGEAREYARQDKAIESLKAVVSLSMGEGKSLYDVFLTIGNFLYTEKALYEVSQKLELDFGPSVELDIMRLVAFRFVDRTAEVVHDSRFSKMRLSVLGEDVLHRLERQTAIAESARIRDSSRLRPSS